jgi:hypothetical protein
MYYPGQGVVLALGRLLFGHPFWGVWLSAGFMCAAFCWALQGWVPPDWALLGGILAIIRLGTFSYWANSYWGGSLPAFGGALVIGALPRIAKSQRTRDALLMSFGFAILANTRPFESLFFCLPMAVGLLAFLCCKVRPRSTWIRTVLLPMAAVLAVTIALMGLYFYKTTGSPFKIPYQLNMQRYGYVYFPWQRFNTQIAFNHEVMRRFYVQQLLVSFERYRTQTLTAVFTRALDMWVFFVNFAFMVPLLFLIIALPANIRLRSIDFPRRILIVAFVVSIAGLFADCYLSPHYAAPITCAFYLLYAMAIRQVYSWSPWRRPVGKALVRAVVVICVMLALIFVARPGTRPTASFSMETWFTHWEPLDRSVVERTLRDAGGPDLVVVRYDAIHHPSEEWVFNDADIDHSKVIWARDMGWEKNQELLNYYRGRKVWLLEPDYNPPRLTRYPTAEEGTAKLMSP